MNGYLLTIAVFVVTAGRLGDMFGRKRCLPRSGWSSSRSARSSPAPPATSTTLILGRLLQGLGAAPMLPLSLAIVCDAFPTERQPRALGIWAAISAIALAIGPLAAASWSKSTGA